MKAGGRLIKHARYFWLLLAESHLTRRLFGSMLRRIAELSLPAGLPRLWEPGSRSRAKSRVVCFLDCFVSKVQPRGGYHHLSH